MFVSPDDILDLQTDPQLEISLSDELVQQEKRGVKAGETAEYDGYLDVILPFGHCPFQLKYVTSLYFYIFYIFIIFLYATP